MTQRDSLKAYERQKQALKLALAGLTYQEIADALGYNSRQAAWKSVNAALKKTLKPETEELRTLQVLRLDRMLAAVWQLVLAGDLDAINSALKIETRRAKLLGTDAPELKDFTSGGKPISVIGLGIDTDEL